MDIFLANKDSKSVMSLVKKLARAAEAIDRVIEDLSVKNFGN